MQTRNIKPFVRLRCGVKTHVHADTNTSTDVGPVWKWTEKMGNTISVQRAPKDEGKLCLQVYDAHRFRDKFLGGKTGMPR